MWSVLFRHLFDSNFYNVFSYSYDDHLSGKSTYDVEHLCGSNFYNMFSYFYDDYLSGKSPIMWKIVSKTHISTIITSMMSSPILMMIR